MDKPITKSKSTSKFKKWLLSIPLALGLVACGTPLMSALVPNAVTADELEQAASLQYRQLITEVKAQNALVPTTSDQFKRLLAIEQRLIPFTYSHSPKAEGWDWQVILINSKTLNAFCMPGGKIAFYTGIINELKLTDDEIAMIMGHEMAHALREHSLNQINKDALTHMGIALGTKAAGIDNIDISNKMLALGSKLLSLKFSRSDESEADLMGQEIAARAGYNPQAAITLWEKMAAISGSGSTSPFLSTHPQHEQRIADLKANLPNVMPLYEEALRAQGGAASQTNRARNGRQPAATTLTPSQQRSLAQREERRRLREQNK